MKIVIKPFSLTELEQTRASVLLCKRLQKNVLKATIDFL